MPQATVHRHVYQQINPLERPAHTRAHMHTHVSTEVARRRQIEQTNTSGTDKQHTRRWRCALISFSLWEGQRIVVHKLKPSHRLCTEVAARSDRPGFRSSVRAHFHAEDLVALCISLRNHNNLSG